MFDHLVATIMKNIKTILFFISVFALIFSFLNIKITPSKSRVLKCEAADIHKITLKNSEQDIILLELLSQKQDWLLRTIKDNNSSVRHSADQKVVKKMASLLCQLPFTESFTATSDQLSEYGLKSPLRSIDLQEMNEHSSAKSLFIGHKTSTTTDFYVTTSETPETIFVVNVTYLPHLLAQTPDLLERHLFDSLQEKETLWIQKSENVSSPLLVSKEIRDILRAQNFTHYQGPLNPNALSDYGMSLPDFKILWKNTEGESATYTFSFFSKYYLHTQIGKEDYILILDPDPAVALWKKISELQY